MRPAHSEFVKVIKWISPNWSLDCADILPREGARRGAGAPHSASGAIDVERKSAAFTVAGDPNGMLGWHLDIQASLATPGLDVSASVDSDGATGLDGELRANLSAAALRLLSSNEMR